MAKINKKNTNDVFAGIKYVDKLLNEAASVGNPPKTLTFEEKIKNKLKGGINEADEVNTKTNDPSYNYEYNYNEAEELEVGDEDKIIGGDTIGNEGEDLGDEFADIEDLSDDFEDIGEDFADIGDEFEDLADDLEGLDNEEEEEESEEDKDIEVTDLDDEGEEEKEFDFTEDAALMEAILSEVEPAIETPDDVEVSDAGVDMTGEVGQSGGAAVPAEAATADELGGVTPEEVPTDGMEGATMGDAGAGLGSEAGVSAPSMATGDAGMEPSGMEDETATMQSTPLDQPEDIDQLISDLVSGTENPEDSSILGENAMSDLGYKDAKDQDITSTVKNKGMKTEGEIKLTKLNDKDITGNVRGATANKATTHSGTGKKVDPSGEEFTDLGDDEITGAAPKLTGRASVDQPKFAAVVKENEKKTKALYALAEKVITLEDEVANLKFSKFRLEKVNAVLTLLPELKLSTREKLVEKFEACKSYAETKKLYTEVASMVKDHKRGSLNEAVNKVKTSEMRYFGESVEGNESPATDANQDRINMLMGLKGNDDSYGVY